jgi:hypothetical protein
VSANDIIAVLPNLNRAELEAVDAKVHELLASSDKDQRTVSPRWGRHLAKLAGTVEGLPADYALNHDHYLHGTPKR